MLNILKNKYITKYTKNVLKNIFTLNDLRLITFLIAPKIGIVIKINMLKLVSFMMEINSV